MKAENISLIVDSICKDLGIKYNSKNPHYISLQQDVLKMRKIYLQLKETIEILMEIEDRHNLNGLREKMEVIIRELDEADHLVIKLAKQIKDDAK